MLRWSLARSLARSPVRPEALTQPYGDSDEEEQAALARAEAEAAVNRQRARSRQDEVDPTPTEEYGHLPIPIRPALKRATDWTINIDIYIRFVAYCRCDKNAKLEAVTSTIEANTFLSLVRYCDTLQRCKSIAQWRARALGARIPSDAVLATRTKSVAIRMLVVRFLFESSPGDAITADLKDRDYSMSRQTEEWLSQ